jgi:hypothetical protein
MAINTARTSTEDGESPSPRNFVAEVEQSSLRWTSKVVEEICESLYVSKSVSRALSSVCRSARSCWHWLSRLVGLIRGVGEVSCPARAPAFDVDMREVYHLWRARNKVARERENERTRERGVTGGDLSQMCTLPLEVAGGWRRTSVRQYNCACSRLNEDDLKLAAEPRGGERVCEA